MRVPPKKAKRFLSDSQDVRETLVSPVSASPPECLGLDVVEQERELYPDFLQPGSASSLPPPPPETEEVRAVQHDGMALLCLSHREVTTYTRIS